MLIDHSQTVGPGIVIHQNKIVINGASIGPYNKYNDLIPEADAG